MDYIIQIIKYLHELPTTPPTLLHNFYIFTTYVLHFFSLYDMSFPS